MDTLGTCRYADYTDQLRLFAVVTAEGWSFIAYDRQEKREIAREFATDESAAKAWADNFVLRFQKPNSIYGQTRLEWKECGPGDVFTA